MDTENIQTQLKELLEQITETKDELAQEYEKFEVALTGALRLLSGEGTSITSIKGNPRDLIGYLIRFLSDMQHNTLLGLETIQEKLTVLQESVQNS